MNYLTSTTASLLARIVGVSVKDAGIALALVGGVEGMLGLGDEEIAERTTLSSTKIDRLRAALEFGRRAQFVEVDSRFQIRSPADAATLLMGEMRVLDQEHLRAVLLDTKTRVQQITTIYIGSVNSASIRVGEVFKEAIRRNSAALILAHNHPSGDPTPSREDILVTRQIVSAGKLLDCEVLDHLVIGHGRYVSMREKGQGFHD